MAITIKSKPIQKLIEANKIQVSSFTYENEDEILSAANELQAAQSKMNALFENVMAMVDLKPGHSAADLKAALMEYAHKAYADIPIHLQLLVHEPGGGGPLMIPKTLRDGTSHRPLFNEVRSITQLAEAGEPVTTLVEFLGPIQIIGDNDLNA